MADELKPRYPLPQDVPTDDAKITPVEGQRFGFSVLADWQAVNKRANTLGLIGRVDAVVDKPGLWGVFGAWVRATPPESTPDGSRRFKGGSDERLHRLRGTVYHLLGTDEPEKVSAWITRAYALVEGERTRLGLAQAVVAYWDSLDAVQEDDERPTELFKEEMDRRINALRVALEESPTLVTLRPSVGDKA